MNAKALIPLTIVLLALSSKAQTNVVATASESFKSIYVEEAKSQLRALTTNLPNAEVLHSITNLPAEVRERLSGTADVGEPFSPGCVRKYAGDRFLTATKVNHTYIVAIEHGGIVYNWSFRVFVVTDKGKLIREVEPDGNLWPNKSLQPTPRIAPVSIHASDAAWLSSSR